MPQDLFRMYLVVTDQLQQWEELPKVYSLKEEGGILNKYKVVDYAHGIAPGVFVIVTTSLPQVHHEMRFLKMGDGPNYVALYRPYPT